MVMLYFLPLRQPLITTSTLVGGVFSWPSFVTVTSITTSVTGPKSEGTGTSTGSSGSVTVVVVVCKEKMIKHV